MKTTIQVKQSTLEKLKRLKEIKKISNYDDLINKLIEEVNNLPESMFGIDKGKLKEFKESDRFEFREY
jgi:hypothetical protein